MAGLPFRFFDLLTFSQYSDTLLSGDGHWENIFCERKATQWPSRSWTWNFNPAVRANQEYQLWYSEALVNRKDGDNGLERIGTDWNVLRRMVCTFEWWWTRAGQGLLTGQYHKTVILNYLWRKLIKLSFFMVISADIDCDYGLTAVNISSYDNKHQNQKHRNYSSLNVVTLLGLQLKIGLCLARVFQLMDGHGKSGEHERSVRVALSAVESDSRFLSALQAL